MNEKKFVDPALKTNTPQLMQHLPALGRDFWLFNQSWYKRNSSSMNKLWAIWAPQKERCAENRIGKQPETKMGGSEGIKNVGGLP